MIVSEQDRAQELQTLVDECFERHFGRTPLEQRIADIERQTSKLSRYADAHSLREATGDLINSVLQLANEHAWDARELATESLQRIDRRHEIYAQLGRRVKVGILGGAFDPIHSGHIEMSKAAIESGVVDEVWWMPCYSHLAGKRMASAEHRLAMCQLASDDVRGVSVFDFEIQHRFLGETYHLAKKLVADETIQARCVLHMIFGRDNAESMHAGSNFEGLQRLMPIIVIPRGDLPTPPSDAWYRRKPHCYIDQHASKHDTNSTDIRRRLADGDPSVGDVVPKKVLQYIRSQSLYDWTAAKASPAAVAKNRRVAVMIGSFDPPTTAQVRLVETLLSSGYESVKIFPSAHVRGGLVIEHAEPVHRAALIDLTFGGRPRVEIDFRGLEDERAVAPATLMRSIDTDDDLWFVVLEDAVAGVSSSDDLRNAWQDGHRLWNEAGFIIVTEPNRQSALTDLPVRNELIPLADIRQPFQLRQRLFQNLDVSEFLPEVAGRYIERHRLFQSVRSRVQLPLRWEHPRVRLVYDHRNSTAARLAERYRRWEADDADLILVVGGDGTMLHAIREYWRLRLPFIGINAGHLGFLMNQKPFDSLDALEVVAYRMPMLNTVVESTSGEIQRHLAFSDAWIERQTGQAAWFRLDVDGDTRVPKIVGDGLLVATPSGSSSYARAMGATPVPLDTQSLTIAGSNIFRPRFWQPLMMPADAKIQITTLDHSGKRPVQAFVDGVPAGPAESIQVSRSHIAAIELAFSRDSDLSAKLLASLLPVESGSF
jgi:NAD+ kinase